MLVGEESIHLFTFGPEDPLLPVSIEVEESHVGFPARFIPPWPASSTVVAVLTLIDLRLDFLKYVL